MLLTENHAERAPTLYYSAQEAVPLATLDVEKISQMVSDLDIANSDKEHYVTGWLEQSSIVLIRNYQDKRGTSNGIVLNRNGRYRFSLQAIKFRIPRFLLWITFRRKPRTMTLITYNTLGEQASGLQQLHNILDDELKAQLHRDWLALNDYIGRACWQLDNDTPLWRALQEEITDDALTAFTQAEWFNGKKLQHDGEFQGAWAGDLFIARGLDPSPSVQISWRDKANDDIATYQFTRGSDGILLVGLRPRKNEKFYPLNRFDADHLQQAMSLFQQFSGSVTAEISRTDPAS